MKSVEDYFQGIKSQNRSMLSQAITLVESINEDHQKMADELLTKVLSLKKKSLRVAVTGTPGVGKSTFLQTLTKHLSKHDKKIAILAIDPSSVRSGGSILGDKTRMGDLTLDENVYIRPTPSHSKLGGVSHKTREAIQICEAFGFDFIIVETVGVGQSEVSVKDMVDYFIMLGQPGAGDELQGIKRGILEVVDHVIVNKADGENKQLAKLARTQLMNSLHILRSDKEVPVDTCSALENQDVDKIAGLLMQMKPEDFSEQRKTQEVLWMKELIETKLIQKFYANEKIKDQVNGFQPGKQSVPEFVSNLLKSIKI